MTTARQLQILKSADDPEEILPLRIDVVRAAVAWYDAHQIYDLIRWAAADAELDMRVRKYKAALRRREKLRGA